MFGNVRQAHATAARTAQGEQWRLHLGKHRTIIRDGFNPVTPTLKTLWCTVVVFAFSSLAAVPEQEQAATIPSTDDLEAVVRQFAAAGTATKSEFETTAQYEARIQQSRPAGRRYAFVDGSYASSGSASQVLPEALVPLMTQRFPPSFAYNADEGVMTTTIPDDLTLKVVVRRADSEIGQNSFGARTNFQSILSDEFAVDASRASVSWLNDELFRDYPGLFHPTFSFPLSVEQAREIKPYLRIVLAGTVSGTEVRCRPYRTAATLSKPVQLDAQRCSIDFDITEVRIVDARTGKEVTTFNSTFGPHKVGETFRAWLAITALDKACQRTPKTPDCEKLAIIKKAGHGEFSTTDDSHREVAWIFTNGKLDRIRGHGR